MATTLTVARSRAATVFVWLAPSWQPQEGLMLQATKPKPKDLEDQLLGIELEGDMRNVSTVGHILHRLTADAGPIDGDDHDAVCWLVNELLEHFPG